MKFVRTSLVWAVLVGWLPLAAEAAFSNYNSLLVGDLAAGVGGAGVALVGDASSMAFYNPATMAQTHGSAFSAAVGVYKKIDTVYGQNEEPTKAPLRVNQGFFRSLPASTGNVLTLGSYHLGLSIVVPDYDNFKGDVSTTLENTSSLSYVDESLWVGGAVASDIDEVSSWGVSLYYTARNFQRTVSDKSVDANQNTQQFSQEKTLTQNTLVAQLGYYRQVTDALGAGVVLRMPAYRVAARGSLFQTYTDVTTNPPNYQSTSNNFQDLQANAVIPGKLGFGLAYQWPSFLLSTEIDIYPGVSYFDFLDEAWAARVEHRTTTNFMIGGEYEWNEWFKIRSGFFTNFSSHPDPDPGVLAIQEDKVDMLGFSASFLLIAGNKIGYTFGGYYVGGRGRSLQRVNQQPQILVKTQHVFTMLVGTSFFF